MVIPLFVGREKSITCLESAMEANKQVLLVAQKEADTDEPSIEDLFKYELPLLPFFSYDS